MLSPLEVIKPILKLIIIVVLTVGSSVLETMTSLLSSSHTCAAHPPQYLLSEWRGLMDCHVAWIEYLQTITDHNDRKWVFSVTGVNPPRKNFSPQIFSSTAGGRGQLQEGQVSIWNQFTWFCQWSVVSLF